MKDIFETGQPETPDARYFFETGLDPEALRILYKEITTDCQGESADLSELNHEMTTDQ